MAHPTADPPTIDRPVALAKAVWAEMRAEDVPFMAGAIAYQAFLSLVPLLVLLVIVTATVGGDALVERLVDLTAGQLPESAQQVLTGAVDAAAGRTGATLIGLVTLVFGGFKIFRGLDTAFAELFDTEGRDSIVDTLRDAAVVFAALLVAVVALVAAGSAFAFLELLPFGGWLAPVLLVVGLGVAFLPMYYVFPDVDLSLSEVLPGVAVAAVGWAALEALFQVYLAFAGGSTTTGALGAVVVLVTWLYFGGLLLLIGATVNAVVAGRADARIDDRPETPDETVGTLTAFEDRLDALVEEARANGVEADGIWAVLHQRSRSRVEVWKPDD